MVVRFASELPGEPGAWLDASYRSLLRRWRLDSFGLSGSWKFLHHFGFCTTAAGFAERAWGRIRVYHNERIQEHRKAMTRGSIADEGVLNEKAISCPVPGGVARHHRFDRSEHRRVVYCYVEFDFVAHDDADSTAFPFAGASGSFICESGYREGSNWVRESTWLVAEDLPNSRKVDRVLCAEFQAITALCLRLQEHFCVENHVEADDAAAAVFRRSLLAGSVYLFATGVSCISCLGALRQFQQLFPGAACSLHMEEWWPNIHPDGPPRVLH